MAVGDPHVFHGFLTPVLTQISIQSHLLPFSHASPEVREEKTPKRKFASPRVLNSKKPGYESDTLTTEPPGWGRVAQWVTYLTHNLGALGSILSCNKLYFVTIFHLSLLIHEKISQ